MTAIDVAKAIRNQNLDAPAGQIGQPPASRGQSFQLPISTLGRLNTPEQFGDIIVKVGQGRPPQASTMTAAPRRRSGSSGVAGAGSLSSSAMSERQRVDSQHDRQRRNQQRHDDQHNDDQHDDDQHAADDRRHDGRRRRPLEAARLAPRPWAATLHGRRGERRRRHDQRRRDGYGQPDGQLGDERHHSGSVDQQCDQSARWATAR